VGEPIELKENTRYIFNAGSVGQPRDGDARACYLTFDRGMRAVEYHRVIYDTGPPKLAIEEARLPEFLARRLALGI